MTWTVTWTAWPPYRLLDEDIEAKARERLDRLERLYHKGQQAAWDGKKVLAELIAKHGRPRVPEDGARKEPLLRILSILLWGELAAWAISADLAERIEDTEAKMAATSQAHDEARHFYVLRDYCRALGEPVPRLGGISRRLLVDILATDSLVHKLVGMQLLVESNALAIFKAVEEAKIEPVLSELLPYYERDEARHVGLGAMYLPRLLRDLSPLETARLVAFQLRCVTLLMTGGITLRPDFEALGIDQRKSGEYVMRMQGDIMADMLRGDDATESAAAGGRRRDAVRGLLNPLKGLGPRLLDFVHPRGGVAAAPLWHRTALGAWAAVGRLADRWLA